jgi:hypothetical protein
MSNLKNEITAFILNWNKKYPIDLWWRNKHKIPFGSKIHKDISFIEMIIEYEEDKILWLEENPNAEIDAIDKKENDKEFEEFNIEDYNNE